MVGRVYSVERIAPLQEKAKKTAALLRMNNVKFKHSDGNWGWPEEGPYDAILSAAAPDHIPLELAEQLKVGGRLILPVGDDHKQDLIMVTREEDGFTKRKLEPVMFVPMLSGTQK